MLEVMYQSNTHRMHLHMCMLLSTLKIKTCTNVKSLILIMMNLHPHHAEELSSWNAFIMFIICSHTCIHVHSLASCEGEGWDNQLREGPLICALFKIRTMFGFNLTHPPTLQFEQPPTHLNSNIVRISKSARINGPSLIYVYYSGNLVQKNRITVRKIIQRTVQATVLVTVILTRSTN